MERERVLQQGFCEHSGSVGERSGSTLAGVRENGFYQQEKGNTFNEQDLRSFTAKLYNNVFPDKIYEDNLSRVYCRRG